MRNTAGTLSELEESASTHCDFDLCVHVLHCTVFGPVDEGRVSPMPRTQPFHMPRLWCVTSW